MVSGQSVLERGRVSQELNPENDRQTLGRKARLKGDEKSSLYGRLNQKVQDRTTGGTERGARFEVGRVHQDETRREKGRRKSEKAICAAGAGHMTKKPKGPQKIH